jgi:hypothetical protein
MTNPRVFRFEQLFAMSYFTLFVMRTGLPAPDLRKLDLWRVGIPSICFSGTWKGSSHRAWNVRSSGI